MAVEVEGLAVLKDSAGIHLSQLASSSLAPTVVGP
jgi:hypothetical protein